MSINVQIPLIFEILGSIIALGMLYIAGSDLIIKVRQNKVRDVKESDHSKARLEVRVQELEGMIETHYGELKTKLAALETQLQENRATNVTFEGRVINSVDKLDNKLESLKDLVIKLVVTNTQKG